MMLFMSVAILSLFFPSLNALQEAQAQEPVLVLCHRNEKGREWRASAEIEKGVVGSVGLSVGFDNLIYNITDGLAGLSNCGYADEFKTFLLEKQGRYTLSVPLTNQRANEKMLVKADDVQVYDSEIKKTLSLSGFLSKHHKSRLKAEGVRNGELNRKEALGENSGPVTTPRVSGQSSSIKVGEGVEGRDGPQVSAAPAVPAKPAR